MSAKAPSASKAVAGVSWMVSSKASVPSRTLTIGSSAICVATAGARAPDWSELWLSVMLTQPTATSAYTCQCSRTDSTPSSSCSTVAFVSAALRAKRIPAAVPISAARCAGERPRAPRVSAAASPPHAANDATHSLAEASSAPPVGSARTRNAPSPDVTATAAQISRRVTRLPPSLAPSGSANTMLVARTGCTTTSRPTPSAQAWATNPSPSAAMPASQRGLRASATRNPARRASSSDACDATCSCSTVPSEKRSAAASARTISTRAASHAANVAALTAPASPSDTNRVLVLAAGGTISMKGEQGAVPDLDGAGLVAAIPGLAGFEGLTTRTIVNKPSTHLALDEQLEVCRQARDAARRGTGVVVTHGTDTLEETAMLCDILHDADAPIVFTGAIRPASAPGADGPANLVDAVSVAASKEAAGMGVLVCFGGEIHHARGARKTDTVSLVAFSSPQTGLLGRVTEGHPIIWSRIPRNPPLDPPDLNRSVVVVPTVAGDDGSLARAALATEPDGAVVGTLGAGHLAPSLLELWGDAAERIPVVAYTRPERGVILSATYGYAGSEQDLRGTNIIPAGFLSPQAARMKLLACLASGLTIEEVRWAFRQDDG
jgi:L-asparaginase